MKRRTELARGAPLVTRKGLAPGKGLARTARKPREAAEPSQKPAKVAGGTRRATGIPKAARDAVRARSGGICELRLPGVCLGPGHNVHHRRARGMGGTRNPRIHDLPNLLHVCGSGNASGCHGYIENHPYQSVASGWQIPTGSDPAAREVLLDGRWVYLTHDGDYSDSPPSTSEVSP